MIRFFSFYLNARKLVLLEGLSAIHVLVESLPQAMLQAGAIVIKSVVNNDLQCLYDKHVLEKWIEQGCFNSQHFSLSEDNTKFIIEETKQRYRRVNGNFGHQLMFQALHFFFLQLYLLYLVFDEYLQV